MDYLMWPGVGFDHDKENDSIWFSTYWSNYLVNYSLKEQAIVQIEVIPVYDNERRNALLFSDLKLFENKLVLVPCNGTSVQHRAC